MQMRKARFRAGVATVMLLGASASGAVAAPYYEVFNQLQASAIQAGVFVPGGGSQSTAQVSADGTPLTLSDSRAVRGSVASMYAWAGLVPGAVGASSTAGASVSNNGPEAAAGIAEAFAYSRWDDLIFSGPTAFVDVVAHYEIDGALFGSSSGNASASASVAWLTLWAGVNEGRCFLSAGVVCEGGEAVGSNRYKFTVSARVPVGVPILFDMGLTTRAGASGVVNYAPNAPSPTSAAASASALFESTMNLAAVPFTLPQGYTVDSVSMGIVDNRWIHAESQVPEPGTLLLLTCAVSALLRRRRQDVS